MSPKSSYRKRSGGIAAVKPGFDRHTDQAQAEEDQRLGRDGTAVHPRGQAQARRLREMSSNTRITGTCRRRIVLCGSRGKIGTSVQRPQEEG